ncbi:16S rRNA (guanine(527)-N(7))-methyltransferase RsmG [Paenibacillus psychroresistens]|uniref:Ribosomal RNA small subunit methyltransferase G n=1 Tax=Paenibacillus psychroresistens TaxID=1778678 RepID=A0A6B8RXY2_9BACL|nr:16S rRNA (guanine(527)-N(7))-methyltransferase RsmG [Paenibacillus psychroresistens]QGR00396.1 16S rRNA (guanine(527)-N(7))-methyltransferase RsmG [Paenibacillus psychroresistens]
MDAVENQFYDLLMAQGISLSVYQLKQFSDYYEQLVIWNEKMNLTGITEREQVYIKHFYDSVSLSFYVSLPDIQTLADIGSGAGFPSIPLKIIFPHLKITIVDSLNKRIQFLNHIVSFLHLDNVSCVHGRAEDLARNVNYRDHFDLVTARAVAKLNVLSELCLPFVNKSGLFVAMKGSDPTDELNEAKYSLKQLKANLSKTFSFELPFEQANRHLIVIQKKALTPILYPRKAGIPSKEPLI